MKYLNPIYLRQTADFLQRYGVRSVLNKVPEYLRMTRGYQAWRRENAPSDQELDRQREIFRNSFRRNSPLFSILVPAYQTNLLQLEQMIASVLSQTYGNWELCIADGSPKPSEAERFLEQYAASHQVPFMKLAEPARADQAWADQAHASQVLADQERAVCGIIRFVPVENRGIAGNTNAALAVSRGDYVVLLDHDDLLSPDALFELAQGINEDETADVLYTDEDMVSADGAFLHNPNFKPDYSPDLLRSCNYITHLYVVRRDLALEVGGFSEDCDGSQDYDFTLKTTERARKVRHIPKVLYHWRVHGGSVAADSGNKTYAYDSAVRALERHYERCGVHASVSKDPQPGFYLTDYAIAGRPLVSVVMYHCAEGLREEILNSGRKAGLLLDGNDSQHGSKNAQKTVSSGSGQASMYAQKTVSFGSTQASMYAQKTVSSGSTQASKSVRLPYRVEFPRSICEACGEYVLVLQKARHISPETIRLLLSNCMRDEIGIAAPRVLYASGKVEESGLIYNADGEIFSPFEGADAVYPGYHCLAVCQHQASVTGPFCFMTSMENLRRNWKKDSAKQSPHIRMAGFCLRTNQDGKLLTVIPRACVTLTNEGARDASALRHLRMPEEWNRNAAHENNAGCIDRVDPYYTPNFSQKRMYRF